MPEGADAIVLEGVEKSLGGRAVLEGIDLRVPAGSTTAIIGPSGAGKSVLLRHLVGLLRPDAGRVEVLGTDLGRADRQALYAVRRRLGMLFQDGALFDDLTVGENVAFPLRHHRPDLDAAARRRRVEEVLELVHLPGFAGRDTGALSGGQRKRVGLARAIVGEPELVLFDEPTSGLDPITSDAIDALILEMKRVLGVTFVLISHDIVGTFRVADRVAMLHGGRIVAAGKAADFLRTRNPTVRRFLRRNLRLPGDDGPPTLPEPPLLG